MEILAGYNTPAPSSKDEGEKGLENQIGDNNCFLNVVIQTLWHLDSFRLKFTSMKRDHKHQDPCAFCSLEIIFTQYEFSDESQIPPTVMRETMANLFKSSSRFQLFELDDAAELFEALLNCLHNQFLSKNDDLISSRRSSIQGGEECKDMACVTHRVFGINTLEQLKCSKCGASSEPLQSTILNAYAYAAALRTAFGQHPTSSFCQLLHFAGEDKRPCPNREKCNNVCSIIHYLQSLPEVFATSIVWDSDAPSLNDIDTVFRCLSLRIDLGNVFAFENQNRSKGSSIYRFRGMICYYGKHYSAYFYNSKNQQWYVFDDTTVKPLGSDWPAVRQRCLKGRLQPSVVFYEREEVAPVHKDNKSFAQSIHSPQSILERDFSHIKISKIVHNDIEKEIKKTLEQDSTAYAADESFIFVPQNKLDQEKEDVDILVTRTNWLYRKQMRRLRFKDSCFLRVVPGTAEVKDTFEYKDVFDITVTDPNSMVIRFYSGKEAQYIQSDKIDDIIQVITRRSKLLNHKFPVKR